MKSIAIPVILLLIVIALVVITSVYSVHELNLLIEKTNALPEEPNEDTVDKLKKIEKLWNDKKELYSATIKYDFIYNFSKEINNAKAGCVSDDPGTYLSAKKSIIVLLEYLRDVQSFRVDNFI